MDEPKSLEALFTKKIFRIPDYQRGYAWQRDQLKDFWEDLINLSDTRSHYTGVLTLALPKEKVAETDPEYWLVDEHGYQVYHIVDGQQRLTTFIILLQSLVDFIKALPENEGKKETEIYITDSLNLEEVQKNYLFKSLPRGAQFRTYKFGYTADNPSYRYLKHRILGEPGGGTIDETFYTLNLGNARDYFTGQFKALHEQEGLAGLQKIFKKLGRRFLLNEYIIKDEFDVFVAFETMNNRGKKLSDLELLKNRLIYLTTLYDGELDEASRNHLRQEINDAWKEVYHQLGRNKSFPLNDDDFLRAHWILYFKYSRETGRDYIKFLLNEQFTPKKVHQKSEQEVTLEIPQEVRAEQIAIEGDDAEIGEATESPRTERRAILKPTDIGEYIHSLKESAVHWFTSFYPEHVSGLTPEVCLWIQRLNRVGMTYFQPLVMAILKSQWSFEDKVDAFRLIERFIFIVFRMTTAKANFRSSEFYNAAREVDKGSLTLEGLRLKLTKERMDWLIDAAGILKSEQFLTMMSNKFDQGGGYYSWSSLRYFLYEYEFSLMVKSRQTKVNWDDLLKSERDMISIEHIYPQTETPDWAKTFEAVAQEQRGSYNGTLGNLLILSKSINSALQNDNFDDKKRPKFDSNGNKVRNGYADGSHSEIEVSQNDTWGPDQIRERGIKLLRFMETRWDFKFKNDEELEKLLFLSSNQEAPATDDDETEDSSPKDYRFSRNPYDEFVLVTIDAGFSKEEVSAKVAERFKDDPKRHRAKPENVLKQWDEYVIWLAKLKAAQSK
jgi:hypothetical protein